MTTTTAVDGRSRWHTFLANTIYGVTLHKPGSHIQNLYVFKQTKSILSVLELE